MQEHIIYCLTSICLISIQFSILFCKKKLRKNIHFLSIVFGTGTGTNPFYSTYHICSLK